MLRFHWKWTDHEYNQVKHMQETFRALIAEMGGKVFSPMPTKEQGYGIATGGAIIHELGGDAHGRRPERRRCSTRTARRTTCKNLFVADGGPFVSQADKNPTWTILALAWRTRDYIARAAQGGGAVSDDRTDDPADAQSDGTAAREDASRSR